jgi:hypothetical protein
LRRLRALMTNPSPMTNVVQCFQIIGRSNQCRHAVQYEACKTELGAGGSRIRTPGPTCDGIAVKRGNQGRRPIRAILGGGHDGNGKIRDRAPCGAGHGSEVASAWTRALELAKSLGDLEYQKRSSEACRPFMSMISITAPLCP